MSLKDNGEDVTVTNENKTEFVQLYADYLLNTSIARQFDALSRGFHKVRLRPYVSDDQRVYIYALIHLLRLLVRSACLTIIDDY